MDAEASTAMRLTRRGWRGRAGSCWENRRRADGTRVRVRSNFCSAYLGGPGLGLSNLAMSGCAVPLLGARGREMQSHVLNLVHAASELAHKHAQALPARPRAHAALFSHLCVHGLIC